METRSVSTALGAVFGNVCEETSELWGALAVFQTDRKVCAKIWGLAKLEKPVSEHKH